MWVASSPPTTLAVSTDTATFTAAQARSSVPDRSERVMACCSSANVSSMQEDATSTVCGTVLDTESPPNAWLRRLTFVPPQCLVDLMGMVDGIAFAVPIDDVKQATDC